RPDEAESLELGSPLGNDEPHRHGAEWLPTEVEVETRADHAPSRGDEATHDRHDALVEELDLVDADDGRLRSDERGDLRARAHGTRDERVAVVRAHDLHAVAIVDDRLEDLDRSARDDC